MTVPVERERPCKESNVVTVKRVKGQMLQRAESYSEALPVEDPFSDAEDGDGIVLTQYTLKTQRSDAAPVTTPNSPALRRNVKAWSDATGLPATITIRFQDRVFHLHKFPLVSRSGCLKRALTDTTEITLPNDVPGGSETFELVSNFCYGSTVLMEPANIAEVCCLADYLQMTEDYGRANLCERGEVYLTQVALQSWDDTLVVLEHCERLAPYAEQLGIVRRCLDALAFMACMELLDPVARNVKQSSAFHWWVQDLVILPPRLFVKLVLALRREGMQENYVGQVITAFTDRWIFESSQKLGHKRWVAMTEPDVLIESVVGLLPLERGVVPIGFLFALLRRGLTCGLNDDCRIQLETRIVLQLENATLQDVLLPGKKENESRCVLKSELESMERILKLFLTRFRAFDEARAVDVAVLSRVAKLWDEYLAEIAFDSSITPGRFTELVERVPAHMREAHDEVYRAIHMYLKAHPSTTQEGRLTVCRTLDCQRLSQEACAHAVQNDLMPLRMIVQAMFTQQLQTRSVLNSHLARSILPNSAPLSAENSGRLHTCDTSFRSMGSSFRDIDNTDLCLDDVMYTTAKIEIPVTPQATEIRLRSLEAELSRMRETLSQSLVESRHEPRREPAAASSSAAGPETLTPKGRNVPVTSSHQAAAAAASAVPETLTPKGWSVHMTSNSGRSAQCKMATVHEGAVAAGNSCGGGSGCISQLNPVNGTTGLLAKTLQKLKLRAFGKATKQAPPARFESDAKSRRLVARTDSMPRPATKPRHTRHNSIS